MTVSVWPVNAVTGSPLYAGRVLRQTQSALVGGATSARPLGARSGVRPGTPSNTVTATSTVWTCKPHAGVLDTQSLAEAGPYLYAVDANETGDMTAANATNPRKDIVYAQLSDPAESDGSTVPGVTIGYLAGTAAPVPAAPATPARSMVLAEISVPVSGGGSPTVTWVAPYAVAAGGIIPASALPSPVLGSTTARQWVDVGGVLYSGDGTSWTAKAGAVTPHIRMYATSDLARTAGAWSQATNLVGVGDIQNSVYTAASGAVTIVTGGTFAVSAAISMTGASFAIRIAKVSGVVVLAQTSMGSTTSQTQSVSTTVPLVAGDQIIVQVYPTTALSIVTNAAATPSSLTLTRIGL